MSNIVLTDIGKQLLADLQAAQLPLVMNEVVYSSSEPTGDPDPSVTSLPSVVHFNSIYGFGEIKDQKQAFFQARVDESVGDFTIYRVGYKAEDGTLVFIVHIDGGYQKRQSVNEKTGNVFLNEIIIDYSENTILFPTMTTGQEHHYHIPEDAINTLYSMSLYAFDAARFATNDAMDLRDELATEVDTLRAAQDDILQSSITALEGLSGVSEKVDSLETQFGGIGTIVKSVNDVSPDETGNFSIQSSSENLAIAIAVNGMMLSVPNQDVLYKIIDKDGAETAFVCESQSDELVLQAGAGTNISVQDKTITFTNTIVNDPPDGFKTIQVDGESSIIATAHEETLKLIAGTGITLDTNADEKSITIIAEEFTSNYYSSFYVRGQNGSTGAIPSQAQADAITFVEDGNIELRMDAPNKSITFSVPDKPIYKNVEVRHSGSAITKITADSSEDTIILIAGNGVDLSPDENAKTITFNATSSQSFGQINVTSGSSTVLSSNGSNETLNLVAGTGITLTANSESNTVSIATSSSFGEVVCVSSDGTTTTLVADNNSDALNLRAGAGIALTANAESDSVTISSALSNSFGQIECVDGTSRTTLVADSTSDSLQIIAGTGIALTANAESDSVTISSDSVDRLRTVAKVDSGGDSSSVTLNENSRLKFRESSSVQIGINPSAGNSSDVELTFTAVAPNSINGSFDVNGGNLSVNATGGVGGDIDADGGITCQTLAASGGITCQTLTASGEVTGFGNISDSSLKDDVKPYRKGLDEVLMLQPVSFVWNKKTHKEGTEDIGLIAQDAERVTPEACLDISYRGTKIKGLRYEKLIPVLINAIQELSHKNDLLENRINKLESKIGKSV